MSGFDPLADEILEIGFVFFRMGVNGVEVLEEWTQVFRPTGPVHPKILGLTGITQAELEAAPLLSEHKEFLQEKLGNAVILGHSVKVDISFLEAAGLQIIGGTVDTLELAQFILPTQHSYNLENLIHSFGIVTSASHRALADAQATMLLLEKLLRIYQGFPMDVRHKVQSVLAPFEVIWKSLLLLPLTPVTIEHQSPSPELPQADQALSSSLQRQSVITLPLEGLGHPQILSALHHTGKSWVWVMPEKTSVVALWRAGLAEAVFPAEDYFDLESFQKFLEKEEQTLEEARFAIKVLVWQATNWQNKSIIDLNISFFGGQFRGAISATKIQPPAEMSVIVCDYQTFLKLDEPFISGRSVLLEHIQEFERALSRNVARKASWGFVNFALKTIYNPETDQGDPAFRSQVVDLLARTDLFFGIVRLAFEPSLAGQTFINEEILSTRDYEYNRVMAAAEHLKVRLEALANETGSSLLQNFIDNLDYFFISEVQTSVRWIEMREGYCAFITQPLFVNDLASKVYHKYSGEVTFLQTKSSPQVEKYNVGRVGAENFARTEYVPANQPVPISAELIVDPVSQSELMDFVQNNELPVVIALPTLEEIKDFYRTYHTELNSLGVIYAQGYSGGTNKIIRNFGLRQKSLLIVTHEFLSSVALGVLKPVTVIFLGLKQSASAHPYIQALEKQYAHDLGESFSELRAIQTFEQMVERTYHPALSKVYVNPDPEMVGLVRSFLEATARYEVETR
jgi:DNA polymerase III epsilon subunit-like protein